MATRLFKYQQEVKEEAIEMPSDITPETWQHRVWLRDLGDNSFAVMDFRGQGQKLPRGSTPVYAYNGDCVYGEYFTAKEVELYKTTYELRDVCIFERDYEVDQTAENDGEPEPDKFHIRLYGSQGRLPYHYEVIERDGKLVIPLECGEHDEILVAQGEEFYEQPEGSRSCGIMDCRHYRAAVQDSDDWIDFDHPLNE